MARVLVVDDNAELRSIVSDMLRIEGYAVSEAGDGIEAMEVFTSDLPDAVLLDLRMPRRGGLETLRTIRSRNSKIPVIVLTGVSDPLVKLEAEKSGAFGYLGKDPLDLNHIVGSLRQAIGCRKRSGEP